MMVPSGIQTHVLRFSGRMFLPLSYRGLLRNLAECQFKLLFALNSVWNLQQAVFRVMSPLINNLAQFFGETIKTKVLPNKSTSRHAKTTSNFQQSRISTPGTKKASPSLALQHIHIFFYE